MSGLPADAGLSRAYTLFMLHPHRHAACPLQHAMSSWTTLTPLYEEDVLFALDATSMQQHNGQLSATHGLTDLLTETEDNVSLMAYLRCVSALLQPCMHRV